MIKREIFRKMSIAMLLTGLIFAQTPAYAESEADDAVLQEEQALEGQSETEALEEADNPAEAEDSEEEEDPTEAEELTEAEDLTEAGEPAETDVLTEAEAPEDQPAEWTVLMYLCGTDLESSGAMATTNLLEITDTYPDEQVNFIVETGGASMWHAQDAGLDIAADRIQRYTYSEEGYTLADEQPLANMANAETLSDFIQWGTEKYPAKKYMLVAWDHGGGTIGGLIVDELYDDACMTLEDFGRALKQSNTQFEVVVLDACLMAGIETAQILEPSTHYLIASEEVVPGKGTAYSKWLQYLYDHPSADGYRFSQIFCDSVEQKYAEEMAEESSIITYSALDLSKLDAVNEAYEALFLRLSDLLDDPEMFNSFAYETRNTERYSADYMLDLYDWVSRGQAELGTDISENMMNSIKDMVVSSVRGGDHAYSEGVSFYYSPQDSYESLDHLARSCSSAAYLAFLDRIRPDWTAPEWVYEQVERREDVAQDQYAVQIEGGMNDDGQYQVNVTQGEDGIVSYSWGLMMVDTDEDGSENYRSLGENAVLENDLTDTVFIPEFDGTWPMMDGIPIRMELVQDNLDYVLYNVPVYTMDNVVDSLLEAGYEVTDSMVDALADEPDLEHDYTLRVAYIYDWDEDGVVSDYEGHYELLGIWNQETSALDAPGRDVIEPYQLYEEQISLKGRRFFVGDSGLESSNETVSFGTTEFDEATTIENGTLPAGDYVYVFMCRNAFGRITSTYADMHWDGVTATFTPKEFMTPQQKTQELINTLFEEKDSSPST